MADFLLQATLSNLFVSAVLAVIAWLVQRSGRSATVANLLWTIVLFKMVTPPIFTLPMIEIDPIVAESAGEFRPALAPELVGSLGTIGEGLALSDTSIGDGLNSTSVSSLVQRWWIQAFAICWLLVSLLLLGVTLIRTIRFELLLRQSSHPAPPRVLQIAWTVREEMGLAGRPEIQLIDAQIAPFVWWLGRRPRIVLSTETADALDEQQLSMVLGHEMAHLKRRDHWIRWIECFANVMAWWNPLMWLTRKRLRETEEVACDAMVIEKLNASRNKYATTLLNLAEMLSTNATRPPAVASGINGGGLFEQRLTKIMIGKNAATPDWIRPIVILIAMVIAPVGLVYAQDYEAIERVLGSAIEDGDLTIDQAKVMMDALKKESNSSKQKKASSYEKRVERERRQAMEMKARALREKEMAQREKVKRQDEMEARKRQFMDVSREIEMAVKNGKMTAEDAEKKLFAIRKEMFRSGPDKQNQYAELEAKRKMLADVAREIELAVKDGQMSKEVARKKIAEVKKSMEAKAKAIEKEKAYMERKAYEDKKYQELKAYEAKKAYEEKRAKAKSDEMSDRKRKYTDLAAEIKLAVETGDLDYKDAEKKLSAIRKELLGEGKQETRAKKKSKKAKQGQDADRRKKLEAVAYELELAIKEGQLNEKQAKEKLAQVRKAMSGANEIAVKNENNLEMKRREYAAVANKIESDLKKGELNRKEAEEKLIAIRRELFGKEKSVRSDKEMEVKRRTYEEVAQAIEVAVKDGKLDKEEAKKKLEEIYQKLFGKKGKK